LKKTCYEFLFSIFFFQKRNEENPKHHKSHFLMLEVKQVNFETNKSPFARLAKEVEISMSFQF
jgi:hypothetical protein